jgi:hypothetical protein
MLSDPRYGKYRGVVIDDQDPLGRFRLLVAFPGDGLPRGWAEASLPMHGPWPPFAAPPVGSLVWIEFEAGDPGKPVYTGRIVDASPAAPVAEGASPDPVVEPTGNGGLSIRVASGASISIGAEGIVLDNGKGAYVALTGPTVSVNHGAFEID